MKRICVGLLTLGLMFGFMNCSQPSSEHGDNSQTLNSGQADYSKINPDCFVPNNPSQILSKNELFNGATWNDPHVVQSGSQFIMYASADSDFDQDIKIYRLVSSDGLNWSLNPNSPVLSKGSSAADWDRKSVETPAVILFQGQYYMFYTGYPTTQADTTSYKIGYATSADGITWTKKSMLLAPTNPSGAPNMDFNQYIVAEPAPVVFNNKIYLYFTALGANATVGTTLQTIGLVESSDGITWSSPQQVIIPDQGLYPRSSNWKGYSTPHAVVLDNKVNLFVSVVTDSPFSQVKIHRITSANGKSNWVHDSKEILDKSEFSWTANQIRSPSVFLSGTDLFLWFAGDANVNDLGIGMAQCKL